MSYLIYRELMYPLGEWAAGTETARNQFAQAHHLPPRHQKLKWGNTGRSGSSLPARLALRLRWWSNAGAKVPRQPRTIMTHSRSISLPAVNSSP